MFLLGLTLRTTISCGAIQEETNAYILGKDVLTVRKWPLIERQSDVMNRLIHRSWGRRRSQVMEICSIRSTRPAHLT